MKSSMQGKGLAAPDSKPSPSVNMANLTRLSVLIAERDGERAREAADLVRELGVRDVVVVDAAETLMMALRSQAFDLLFCSEQLVGEDALLVLGAARKAAPATRLILTRVAERADAPTPEDFEVLDLPFSRLDLLAVLHRTAAPSSGLWCEVPELSLTDILQMYHQARRSITVLLSGPIAGSIRMDSGEIVDAESGDERGAAALSRLLEAEVGLLRSEPPVGDAVNTISAPFQGVVLEAARKLDERRRDGSLAAAVGSGSATGAEKTAAQELIGSPGTGSEPTSVSSGVLRSGTPLPQAYPPSPEAFLARPARKPRHTLLVATTSVLVCLALGGVTLAYFGEPLEGTAEQTEPAAGSALAPREVEQAAHALQPAAGGETGLEPTTPTAQTLEQELPSEPTQPAPASFELSITSRPSRATVTEAGRVLGKTPLTLTISAESVARAPRQFVLRLPGHFSYRLTQAASASDVTARAVLWPRARAADAPNGEGPESDGEARPGSSDQQKELGIRLRR
jgi:CheY-like chemotaxis protein